MLLLTAYVLVTVILPHNVTGCVNQKVIGIVTKVDKEEGDPALAETWLRLTGCQQVFHVSSVTGEGIEQLLSYLVEEP